MARLSFYVIHSNKLAAERERNEIYSRYIKQPQRNADAIIFTDEMIQFCNL